MDFRLNFRDHRKIVVVDGRVGYVGGFNIGDQYLGRSKKVWLLARYAFTNYGFGRFWFARQIYSGLERHSFRGIIAS
jgi:Phosphatidylserine/phosphatidylglycerophosphate/cardiolipin synthases and related enzymes